MGFLDKAKDFAGKNPDKVKSALDKVGDAFDKRTGGKHAHYTDTAQQKAGEFLTGRTADAPAGDPATDPAEGRAADPAERPGPGGEQPPL